VASYRVLIVCLCFISLAVILSIPPSLLPPSLPPLPSSSPHVHTRLEGSCPRGRTWRGGHRTHACPPSLPPLPLLLRLDLWMQKRRRR
jgi:hypothetical protein